MSWLKGSITTSSIHGERLHCSTSSLCSNYYANICVSLLIIWDLLTCAREAMMLRVEWVVVDVSGPIFC